MAPLIISIVATLLFVTIMHKTTILSTAQFLLAASIKGISAVLDSELDDNAKEFAARTAALQISKFLWQLLWRFSLSVLTAALPLLIADLTGFVPADVTLDLMLSLEYILTVSVIAIVINWILTHRSNSFSNENNIADQTIAPAYNIGDQLVHMLAFASPDLQRALGALEDWLLADKISVTPDCAPIFITSLARGGTTSLLNAFHQTPQIAMHEYRDMPFVTAPILWSKFSGKRRIERRERAHGDGLEIDLNSPEAFDEVLWRLYWPEKYDSKLIPLWQEVDNKSIPKAVMLRHFKKIIMLRTNTSVKVDTQTRYMSKNNANIGRLRLLRTIFPGCEVIVPLRRPGPHATSLLRQHQNFIRLHSRDEFIRRYMRDIGHFEFGLLQKPIGFEGFVPTEFDPETADYWLRYWIAAFEEVRDHGKYCHIVTQDSIRAEPDAVMMKLCERLELAAGHASFEKFFRKEFDAYSPKFFNSNLLAQAEELYESLAIRAVL